MSVANRLFEIATRGSASGPGPFSMTETKVEEYTVTFWWSTIPGDAPSEKNVRTRKYHVKASSSSDATAKARQKLKKAGVASWRNAKVEVKAGKK